MKPRLTLKGQPDRRHLNPGRPASATPPMVSQAVRLEPATVEALRVRAASLGISPAEAIRAAVAEWLPGERTAKINADLLDALENLLPELSAIHVHSSRRNAIVAEANAAIAKARGGK